MLFCCDFLFCLCSFSLLLPFVSLHSANLSCFTFPLPRTQIFSCFPLLLVSLTCFVSFTQLTCLPLPPNLSNHNPPFTLSSHLNYHLVQYHYHLVVHLLPYNSPQLLLFSPDPRNLRGGGRKGSPPQNERLV